MDNLIAKLRGIKIGESFAPLREDFVVGRWDTEVSVFCTDTYIARCEDISKIIETIYLLPELSDNAFACIRESGDFPHYFKAFIGDESNEDQSDGAWFSDSEIGNIFGLDRSEITEHVFHEKMVLGSVWIMMKGGPMDAVFDFNIDSSHQVMSVTANLETREVYKVGWES